MVEHFYTILKEENAELVEKKSKFIAEIYNVSDKNEAENIIKVVKRSIMMQNIIVLHIELWIMA